MYKAFSLALALGCAALPSLSHAFSAERFVGSARACMAVEDDYSRLACFDMISSAVPTEESIEHGTQLPAVTVARVEVIERSVVRPDSRPLTVRRAAPARTPVRVLGAENKTALRLR